jgi:hypothetical protein
MTREWRRESAPEGRLRGRLNVIPKIGFRFSRSLKPIPNFMLLIMCNIEQTSSTWKAILSCPGSDEAGSNGALPAAIRVHNEF